MPRTIQYARHADGFWISRVGSELCWPILDFDKMGPDNNFETLYDWERIPVAAACHDWHLLRFTKKVPLEVKEFHRKFWDMTTKGIKLWPRPDRKMAAANDDSWKGE